MYRDKRKSRQFCNRGLLYLHIPKAAGSSINNVIGSQFDELEVATHIESKKLLGVLGAGDIEKKYRYISGHVPYPQFEHHLNLDHWFTLATFRKPDEHVVSHIAWVRLLAEDGHKIRFMQHDETIQRIAGFLKGVNFSNSKDILGMINWLEDNNYFLFHNTQTRYLSGGKAEAVIAPCQLNNALKNLESLDYVGITERLDEFILMLAATFGFRITSEQVSKENTNNMKFGMDLSSNAFREAIEPLIEYDRIIYTVARRKYIDSLHQFLATLEMSQFPRFSSVNLNVLRRVLIDT